MALHHRLIGRAARLYWKITRPRTIGVRAILLDGHGRIALVRHRYTEHWYLPGGGVKKGESIEAALRRELAEEVAVHDAAIERVVGIYHSRVEGKDDHVVIFAARTQVAADAELIGADAIEIESARWFPLDDLPDGTSPATARRIAEYRNDVTGLGAW